MVNFTYLNRKSLIHLVTPYPRSYVIDDSETGDVTGNDAIRDRNSRKREVQNRGGGYR